MAALISDIFGYGYPDLPFRKYSMRVTESGCRVYLAGGRSLRIGFMWHTIKSHEVIFNAGNNFRRGV